MELFLPGELAFRIAQVDAIRDGADPDDDEEDEPDDDEEVDIA